MLTAAFSATTDKLANTLTTVGTLFRRPFVKEGQQPHESPTSNSSMPYQQQQQQQHQQLPQQNIAMTGIDRSLRSNLLCPSTRHTTRSTGSRHVTGDQTPAASNTRPAGYGMEGFLTPQALQRSSINSMGGASDAGAITSYRASRSTTRATMSMGGAGPIPASPLDYFDGLVSFANHPFSAQHSTRSTGEEVVRPRYIVLTEHGAVLAPGDQPDPAADRVGTQESDRLGYAADMLSPSRLRGSARVTNESPVQAAAAPSSDLGPHTGMSGGSQPESRCAGSPADC